jgi:predicted flap endonuclease-1-like 5' DNA nuclease
MGVLIAKISGLLVAATLIGIAVDRWWVRRHRLKVKFDYARLLQEGIKPREPVSPTVMSQGERASSDSPRILAPRRLSLLDSLQVPPAPAESPPRDDLARVQRRLDELAEAVAALHIISPSPPVPPGVDLRSLLERIEALEREVRLRGDTPDRGYTTAPRVVPVSVEVTRAIRRDDCKSAPTAGTPDDLKRIKGVKGAMERMLQDIGVQYFWQIAAWSPEEVRQAETRLRQFRGRIERDDWVAQAARLMREPDATPPPDGLRE